MEILQGRDQSYSQMFSNKHFNKFQIQGFIQRDTFVSLAFGITKSYLTETFNEECPCNQTKPIFLLNYALSEPAAESSPSNIYREFPSTQNKMVIRIKLCTEI